MSHHQYPQEILDLLKSRTAKAKRLWIEDDARPPDAERVYGAFQRLFGLNLADYRNNNQPILVIRYFDETWTEYHDGKVISHRCDGDEILQIEGL